VSKRSTTFSLHAFEPAAQLILSQGLLDESAPASRLADDVPYSMRTMDAGSAKFTKAVRSCSYTLQLNMEELDDA
jgi:hypothetical protein